MFEISATGASGTGADGDPGRTGTDVWKNGCENLQSGRKRGSNQWKRTLYFCKVFERCRICHQKGTGASTTKSREVTVHYHNEQAGEVTISMGHLYCGQTEPSGESSRKSEFVPVEYNGRKYMGTCVWMGNLHCIVPMEEISKHAVCEIGEKLERLRTFFRTASTHRS